jgi:hypothetical protein
MSTLSDLLTVCIVWLSSKAVDALMRAVSLRPFLAISASVRSARPAYLRLSTVKEPTGS